MIERIRNYFNLTRDELVNKVSWPTWGELRESTTIVLLASFIFALVIYLMDIGIGSILTQFYKLFK
ncbi:MAG: preprotein translocase subunit SecE [Bacteroidetes bacterium]|jgi:preprotein translocase subunit SecE|nr:preprotein translocase subunit SecE [Bacteroidota bacterium]